jgi:hypothetical protein
MAMPLLWMAMAMAEALRELLRMNMETGMEEFP